MKRTIKKILTLFFDLCTLPFFVSYVFKRHLFGEKKAFMSVTQSISLIPGLTGEWARRSILRWITRMPLTDCCISFGTTFSDPRVVIEDGVYMGARCDIGWAHIGKDTILGSGVHVLSGMKQHGIDDVHRPIKEQVGSLEKVVIGQDSWIGNGAIIGADVGKGCVIGAGAVVTKEIEDYSIAVGNPAKVVRRRLI